MRASHRLFGTDGMRGVFGAYPLDHATVRRLGLELARRLRRDEAAPAVVLGGDTRASTPALCRWLADGLAAGGAVWRFGGVLPTPALAYLAPRLGAAAAVAVSASHNPLPDNGIKLLDEAGYKWDPLAEAALEERLIASEPNDPAGPAPEAAALLPEADLARLYLDGLAATLPAGRPLAGLTVALDAANGAAAPYAAELFASLGARVASIHDRPDGTNINRGCGSTHPEAIAGFVAASGADLGVAFDGDADRAIFADARGAVADGDATLYLWARALRGAGRLEPAAVVATSMSNLGLERALARDGVAVVRCDVGDRAVVETMRRRGILLGGEQSGHVVHLGLATTGDGLLTALQIAGLVSEAGRPLADLLAGFERFPQVLRNVRVREKRDLAALPRVAAAAREAERELGVEGRLVLRYSGTEPLARIMIEGPDAGQIGRLAEELAAAIAGEIGASR